MILRTKILVSRFGYFMNLKKIHPLCLEKMWILDHTYRDAEATLGLKDHTKRLQNLHKILKITLVSVEHTTLNVYQ